MRNLRESDDEDDNTIDKIGHAARRTTVLIFLGLVLSVAVAVLGFLFFAGHLTSEPFLLLVGIIIGIVFGISVVLL